MGLFFASTLSHFYLQSSVVAFVGPIFLYSFFHTKFIINDEKIEKSVINLFRLWFRNKEPREEILYWNEIRQLYVFFIMYEGIPHIRLKPKKGVNKPIMAFAATSIEQVKDILNHLPESTDIILYPELEKMLKKSV